MESRIDTMDERILYRLQQDARNTSAPEIADELDVSPSTVRKRIDRLEEAGVIEGYYANLNFERAEGLLTNLFMCTVPISERQQLAERALEIPGVVNVREVMTGHENLRVKAVATDTHELTRIAEALTDRGIQVEDEDLIHDETFRPYQTYGPDE